MSPSIPFTIGTEYLRQRLLDFTGSAQPNEGIVYGRNAPDYVICTSGGHHKEIYGYEDGPMPQPKSGWFYFGMGGKGDQNPHWRGNRILSAADRVVLLFTAREQTRAEIKQSGNKKKLFLYRGSFMVDGWDYFTPTCGIRAGDQLVRYRLVPTHSS